MRSKPTTCKDCGISTAEGAHISWRRLCSPCGDARELANVWCLRLHTGPFFDHWRHRSLLALGAVIVDDSDLPQ